MKMRLAWWQWTMIALAMLVLVVLLAYPFERTVAPQWRLRVVDEAGNPMRGIAIRQSWQYYGLEPQAHVQEISSDADGYVQFPRRIIRAGTLRIGVARFLTTLNAHDSWGPSASLYALGDYKQVSETPYYRFDKPIATEIVLHRP